MTETAPPVSETAAPTRRAPPRPRKRRLIDRFTRPLDRYVFGEFFRIFVTTALGFPVLVFVIDLTDNLDKYVARDLGRGQIALSYLYWLPDSMFMILPAAVLFATVFSIGALTRHAEVTAAKASGISFYRLTAPIYLGAVMAMLLGLLIAEVSPMTNAKREEILELKRGRERTDRYNFAHAAERGRVYKIGSLNAQTGVALGVEIERKGSGPDYPTMVTAVNTAGWTADRGWTLRKGLVHIIPDSSTDFAFAFDSAHSNLMTERPPDLLATPRSPQELDYADLTRFIDALERSGGDADELRVERTLKIAIPVTCVIIALFGAPLATSTQRGGAAFGIGISLGTTIVFLMMIQLTKAIGEKGIVQPDLAGWIPNVVFAVIGVTLLSRVRT
jgi:lipopolysaccharide export system permease protein